MSNKKIIKQIFSENIDLNKLINIKYDDYIKIYNTVNDNISKYNLSSYHIDKFLTSNKDYNKFIKYKNIEILKKAYKSKYWNQNIRKLKNLSNLDQKTIESKYKKLFLKNYLNKWDGFWSSIKIDTQGNITDISIIDIGDINFIIY